MCGVRAGLRWVRLRWTVPRPSTQVLKEGVLDDIAKGSGASLKSAGPTADRSAPLIAPDVEVTPRDLPTTWPEIQPEMGPRLDRDRPEVVLR